MAFELAKGVRDFGPKEQILRQDVMDKIKLVFERYGYSPMETPVIERLDTLTAKFGAGEGTDVMNEIFKLKDQGNRDLGLKFDQTVPLARYIALNPTIKLPFKRYIIDRSFRDGPIKLGRYREFVQCDADIVGSRSMMAEAEMIMMVIDASRMLGLDVTVEINDRRLLYSIMDSFDVKDKEKAAIVVDKMKKVSNDELEKELLALGVKEPGEFLGMIRDNSDADKLLGLKERLGKEGQKAIDDLLEILSYLGAEDRVSLNLALARGLNYYTGCVIEAFLKGSEVKSSVAGGGRYDEMIGNYCGRGDYPAIGISFGIEPIIEAMKLAGYEEKQTVTRVLVIPVGRQKESIGIAQQLREGGIPTEIDLNARGVSKNLAYANSYGIPFVIFVGDEEIKNSVVKLKDMDKGDERSLSIEEAIRVVSYLTFTAVP